MPRSKIRTRDVEKALKGAVEAGCHVARAEIDPETGKIVVVMGKPLEAESKDQQVNEWDGAGT